MSFYQSNTAEKYITFRAEIIFLFRILIFIFLALWCAGILFPLLFKHTDNFLIQFIVNKLYSGICHQQEEKCLTIGGVQLLVCARCTGIYFGALVSAIFLLQKKMIKINRFILSTALALILADVGLVQIGLYSYSYVLALISGLILGAPVYLYLMRELENFLFAGKN